LGEAGKCPGPRAFWGLALEYQNTPLLAFHVFRLFTTRQNCRDFSLLRSVHRLRKLTTVAFIVFEQLKRIEPNSTTLYDPRTKSKAVHPWSQQKFFQERGEQRRNFAYPFQVADDTM